MQPNSWNRRFFAALPLLLLSGPAYSDSLTYEQEFAADVSRFANLNRLNIARLHRDVHANCYIPVTIATTLLSDGSIKDITIVKSSTVPVVDRYFRYIIEQASPYQPLANHYNPAPEEVTVTYEFKLDVQLWGYGMRSTEPCEELKTLDPQTD